MPLHFGSEPRGVNPLAAANDPSASGGGDNRSQSPSRWGQATHKTLPDA